MIHGTTYAIAVCLLLPLTNATMEDRKQHPRVVVLRVGNAWLVGVGKRAPHRFR